jgi:hypothetical protein
MSKQIEFNVEYSPEHELAAEKAVTKPAAFEITSESIRTIQNVCCLNLIEIIMMKIFFSISISLFFRDGIIIIQII